jgi:HK97 family phage portal protein
MILSSALQPNAKQPDPLKLEQVSDPGGSSYAGRVQTKAKQMVSAELAKQVATVFRCANGIGDDIANMPLQQFVRQGGNTTRVAPDAAMQNMAYLLEVKPNRWMTPFILKKTAINWLLFWGNALIWMPPPPAARELYILPTNMTQPMLDQNGELWYQVRFANGKQKYIPKVEVMHVMINSTNGMWGRSVLEYARETIGLRMGMSETQSSIQGQGLNPSAYVQVDAILDKEKRAEYREAYSELMSGASNAGTLAVFDKKIVKFEPITMKLSDAQFLESMQATDLDIANYFKYPAYKLNLGKQSYESNDQQDQDYQKSTLDPHLVQWEQAARLAWLPEAEQAENYFKFNRNAILRMTPKTRAELHEIEIRSATLKPNEARAFEDRDAYPLGDKFYMSRNNAEVGAPPDGQNAPLPAEETVETPKSNPRQDDGNDEEDDQ